MALAVEGVDLVVAARRAEPLAATAMEIRAATAVTVEAIAADVTTEEGRRKLLVACPWPDILVNNAGGPPAGDFRKFGREDWISALDANMLAPLELIKATIDGMIARRFGRIVNIISHAVKAPIGFLSLLLERRPRRPYRVCRRAFAHGRRAQCDNQQFLCLEPSTRIG